MADVVGFTQEGARRVARAVKALERRPKGGGIPPRPRWPVGGGGTPGDRVAKVGGAAIGVRVGNDPGSGAGTLYDFDGTTLTAGDPITIYNLSSAGTIAAGRWLIVAQVQGYWFADWEDC